MAKNEKNLIKIDKSNGPIGYPLFMTFVGAAVYFVNQVDGFGNIIIALAKAALWPAILIYNILQAFTA